MHGDQIGIMNQSVILYRDNEEVIKKSVTRRARLAFTVAGVACTLMFLAELFSEYLRKAIQPIISGALMTATGDGEYAESISNLISEMIQYVLYLVVPFGIALLFFKLISLRQPRERFASHFTPSLPFLYLFGAIGLSYGINLVSNLLFGDLFELFEQPDEVMPTSVLGVVLTFVSIAVLPAVLEEWAFRGIIQKNLMPYGRVGAIIVSSLLFGLMHWTPQNIIFASSFGFMLAVCYDYTRSIKFTMIMHFTNNLISVSLTYADQIFGEDNELYILFENLYFYTMLIIGIVALIYYIRKGVKKKNVSFARPPFVQYKLPARRYFFHAIFNVGTASVLITYIYLLIKIFNSN